MSGISLNANFSHTHAVVRGVPKSFLNALAMHPPDIPLDWDLALQQHQQYVELIRLLVPFVVEVPVDEATPDCCFIEDTAIILGTAALNHPTAIAILTHPGAISRRPEVPGVSQALQSLGFTLEQEGVLAKQPNKAHRMLQLTPPATLDGGDVLFIGTSLWVGITSRTNVQAVDQLRSMLDGICPVHGLSIPPEDKGQGGLHLKSLVTALDSDLLVVSDSPQGRALVQKAKDTPGVLQGQSFLFVPDMICSNLLRIGPHVVFQSGFPDSEAVVMDACNDRGLTLHCLPMGEFAKVDGALTCLSLLFSL